MNLVYSALFTTCVGTSLVGLLVRPTPPVLDGVAIQPIETLSLALVVVVSLVSMAASALAILRPDLGVLALGSSAIGLILGAIFSFALWFWFRGDAYYVAKSTIILCAWPSVLLLVVSTLHRIARLNP